MPRSNPSASAFAASAYDPVIERGFFGRIVLENGSFKTTNARRLDDLNAVALPYIRAIPDRPVEIMDVASSSGISTQEWYDNITAMGIDARMVGTDLTIEALHLRGKFADLLLDKNLNVIHLSLLGGGVHPRLLKALRISGLSAAARLLLSMGAKPRPFRLVSKAVRNITFVEDDLEADALEFAGRFHVVRVANILNRGYFADDRLRGMVAALMRRLHPRGLLLVCRTLQDGSNHATIFRLEDSCLKVLERLGEGSELEGILS